MFKLLCSAVFVLTSVCLHAQQDTSLYHFGFLLGVNQSVFLFDEDLPDFQQINNKRGIKLGIMMDYDISDQNGIRAQATLSSNTAELKTQVESAEYANQLEQYFLEAGLFYVLKPKETKFNPYFLLGGVYKEGVKNNNLAENVIAAPRRDVAFDLAVGIDKDLTFFHLQPELRYSYGLTNVELGGGLPNASFHSISLIINFLN